MATVTLIAFLAVHGLLHAGIWLPQPAPDPDRPPPFTPDHSGLLTVATVPQPAVHRLALALATLATVAYLMAATAVATNAAWAVSVTVGAALLGLLLKGLYFHPWLTLGVVLDILVLAAALVAWPVSLT